MIEPLYSLCSSKEYVFMGFIKNINNVFIPRCACLSWYDHWTRLSDQWLICCAEYTCTKPISQGALVQKAEEDNNRWYVVPLCKTHANSDGILNVGEVKLVEVEATFADCGRDPLQN